MATDKKNQAIKIVSERIEHLTKRLEDDPKNAFVKSWVGTLALNKRLLKNLTHKSNSKRYAK